MVESASFIARIAECSDPIIERGLRDRFAREFGELEDEGFELVRVLAIRHSLWVMPATFAFGLLGRESMTVSFPYVTWHHPIFISQDRQTLAYPFGLGTRFYSFFENGLTQRTSQVAGKSGYKKFCHMYADNVSRKSLGETWLHHLAFCEQRTNEGAVPVSAELDQIADILTREDSALDQVGIVAISWLPIAVLLYSAGKRFC